MGFSVYIEQVLPHELVVVSMSTHGDDGEGGGGGGVVGGVGGGGFGALPGR